MGTFWAHSGLTLGTLREDLENSYFTCGAHPCPETGYQYFPKRIVSIKLDTDINRGLHDVFLVRCQKGPFGGRSSDSSICFRASHLFPMVRVSSQWQWRKGNINQFKRGRKTPDCELQQCLRSLRILDFSIWEAAWPESRISDPSESSSSFFFPSACVANGSPVVDLFHSAQAILAHWYISVVSRHHRNRKCNGSWSSWAITILV